MTESMQTALLNAIPVIVGSIATAWVTIKQANKKTEETANETNRLLATKTDETSKKLDSVHETVNGNYSVLRTQHDALAAENVRLREQLANANKRSTDPRPP